MPITRITTAVYRFPTPEPEADGTLQWNATTAVTVTLQAGGKVGLGWTAEVRSTSRPAGRPCIAPAATWGPRVS